jgi:1-acyl-sn-glycerol-3-phosphate acyltransferase
MRELAPRYRLPITRLLQAAGYMLVNRPRNIGSDFRFLIHRLPRGSSVEGSEHLPETGPYLLVANHYERPGLWMGWSGIVAARAVYEHRRGRLRWIAIAEWEDYRIGFVPVPPLITRALFGRFFDVFGFIAMEPESAGARQRAEGVRRALKAMEDGDIVGIFPEGDIGETPAMIQAQRGSGSFVLALSRLGPVVPVGLYESDGRLCVRFGPAIEMEPLRRVERGLRDEAVTQRVMSAVAGLLPEELRGAYRATYSGSEDTVEARP